jgi:hypothetical protein
MSARLLVERTGQNLDAWNDRINRERIHDEANLRAWLSQQVMTGYAQSLLVMEQFGYPAFMLASAGELIDAQYADRPQLQPILEAIIAAAASFSEITIQARKTYISLVTPRRTFARIQPTTKNRVDLALRLEGQKPGSRLVPSRIHETMRLQINLASLEDVDAEVIGWLQLAYQQNV